MWFKCETATASSGPLAAKLAYRLLVKRVQNYSSIESVKLFSILNPSIFSQFLQFLSRILLSLKNQKHWIKPSVKFTKIVAPKIKTYLLTLTKSILYMHMLYLIPIRKPIKIFLPFPPMICKLLYVALIYFTMLIW